MFSFFGRDHGCFLFCLSLILNAVFRMVILQKSNFERRGRLNTATAGDERVTGCVFIQVIRKRDKRVCKVSG